MRLVGFFSKRFMTDFWTTYRLPFQKYTTIAYPDKDRSGKRTMLYVDAIRRHGILNHEIIHTILLERWYGPVLAGALAIGLPLPVLFSGRWYLERWAYLADIQRGMRTVNEAVDVLWNGYMWVWPRSWMAEWFNNNMVDWDKTWFDKLIIAEGDHDGPGGGSPA